MKTEQKNLSYYLALPYTKTLRRDEDGDVVARILELPGCSAHGASEQEALQNLEEAQRLWLEDCVAAGDPVPEPEPDDPLPSGKWVQRVPRSLHRKLSQMAKQEGVSLNQLVTSMLSQDLTSRTWQKVFERTFLRHMAIGRRHWHTAMSVAADAWSVESVVPDAKHLERTTMFLPDICKVKVNNDIEICQGYITAGR